MNGDEIRKQHIEDVDSKVTTAITSFHELCERISKLDARIAGAIAIRNGKLLATSIGSGAPLPSDEYLSKMIMQAQVMVGIPLGNKPIFGEFKFTMISYENLETILFYLHSQNAIVGVGVLPPYNVRSMVHKIQNLLKKPIQKETETFT